MKKLVTILLAVVVLSAMLVPASAATEDELMAKFKEISISRHLITEVENLAAAYDVTEEQGDQLMELLEEVKEAFPEDKGPGYYHPEEFTKVWGEDRTPYTREQLDVIMGAIAETCDIMGFTYEFVATEQPMHEHDVSFVVKDEEGRVAFQYDGDLIQKLSEIEEEQSSVPLLVGGLGVVALAGIAVPVAKLKKKEQE